MPTADANSSQLKSKQDSHGAGNPCVFTAKL